MKYHVLKTWPVPFQQVMEGAKTHEFRKDDRGYNVGDVLCLTLYEPSRDLSIESVFVERRVTCITRGPDFGIPEGYCVMSIAPVSEGDER